jgi:hypothetical protein
MSKYNTLTAKIFLLIISLFPLYIYAIFFVQPPTPHHPQPPAPAKHWHARLDMFVLCSLASFREWCSCCHVTSAHTCVTPTAWLMHGMERPKWENWTVILSKCHCRSHCHPPQKQTLNTWIFLASPPNQCATSADCAVGVFHWGFEATRTVAVCLSWPF